MHGTLSRTLVPTPAWHTRLHKSAPSALAVGSFIYQIVCHVWAQFWDELLPGIDEPRDEADGEESKAGRA